MTKPRITDGMTSEDSTTKQWKMRFACARMSYEEGNFKEAERLLARLLEAAQSLPERRFAVNAARVGLGAVQLSTGRLNDAKHNIEKAISELRGEGERAFQELYAVALRFHAELLVEQKNERGAEKELNEAAAIFEKWGAGGGVYYAYTLAELAGVLALQQRFSEAQLTSLRAMRLLAGTLGTEDKLYAQASIIADICTVPESERLAALEAGTVKLQYQFGANHPTMVRALKRYVSILQEKGEKQRIEEACNTFEALNKKPKSKALKN